MNLPEAIAAFDLAEAKSDAAGKVYRAAYAAMKRSKSKKNLLALQAAEEAFDALAAASRAAYDAVARADRADAKAARMVAAAEADVQLSLFA